VSAVRIARADEDLERRKIRLRCPSETIGTVTSDGRLVFHVSALAEFERSVFRERAAGPEAVRARGRKGERPFRLAAADLAAAKALLRDPGVTVERVARRQGVGAATLHRHPSGSRSVQAEGDGVS
jgi:DNA invertase Pin-like site-specific DNA recombinase